MDKTNSLTYVLNFSPLLLKAHMMDLVLNLDSENRGRATNVCISRPMKGRIINRLKHKKTFLLGVMDIQVYLFMDDNIITLLSLLFNRYLITHYLVKSKHLNNFKRL